MTDHGGMMTSTWLVLGHLNLFQLECSYPGYLASSHRDVTTLPKLQTLTITPCLSVCPHHPWPVSRILFANVYTWDFV